MSIFGWRLTRKPVHVESEEVSSLHKLLKAEQTIRTENEKNAIQVEKDLKEQLKYEKERVKIQQDANKIQAIIHLRAAERYNESFEQSVGARQSELKAIIDARVEKVEQLGFKLKGSITETIQWLLTA